MERNCNNKHCNIFFSLIPDLIKQQSKKIEMNEKKQKNINKLLNELILNTHILLLLLF